MRTILRCLAVVFLLPAGAMANWQSAGTMALPSHNYTFLAATPSGDLLAATFYSTAADSPPRAQPALLIRNPGSGNPQVIELCSSVFPANRGYGGIACDPTGSFYVSGDTGDPETSFVRKFAPDGSPDLVFGTNGEIRPGRRCLGMDIFGEQLLVAQDWGRVAVFRADNGKPIGELPKPEGEFFVRDIALDPKSMRVFGVAEGGIVTWGNGTPWQPTDYGFRRISQKTRDPIAGEGISIDPIRRTVLITPIPGNVLNEVHGSGQINRYFVATAAPDAHLGDSVMSFDGETLFISDLKQHTIHTLRRRLADVGAGQATQAVANATTGGVPAPVWHQSYEAIVRQARDDDQPMLVYFRKGNVKSCQDFESQVLLTDQFNRNTAGITCVFEDLNRNRLLAYRFGVYRVPYIVMLDGGGNQVAESVHPIEPEQLFVSMQNLR